ncbi:hypothetical protein MBLNU230_g1279t1 [Neophaeotheca triangularis]
MPQKKAAKAPNQRDTRHDTGLAAPGRPVRKQRSNGQLGAAANVNGKPQTTTPVSPPPLPTTGLNQGFNFPRQKEGPSPSEPASQPAGREHAGSAGPEKERTSSDASLDEVGPLGEVMDNMHDLASTPHVEAQASAQKTVVSQTIGTLDKFATILSYYPLRDAISILILLLSLPPTLGLVVQTLFATLTFVPPSSGISLSTLPSVRELFNASNFGAPALATILIVDMIFYVCYLPLWTPLQGMFLDLSQAVMAVSLSGAASASTTSTYSITLCSLIVCVVHVLRYKAIHLTAFEYARSVLHKWDLVIPLDVTASSSTFGSPWPNHGWTNTMFRTLLGIHIVSQGVTTCIRRYLSKANEQSSKVPTLARSDTDAGPTADAWVRASGGYDSTHNPALAGSTDSRPPGLPSAHRDSRIRESSTKKKRKQANQVRSHQPLWAAIASTKVTFVKEMEQRDAADDAREASAMESETPPTFASTITATDYLWICEVRDTGIVFRVELSPQAASENADRLEEGIVASAGIDKTKPFFVRVNGAAWSSTRILPVPAAEGEATKPTERFDGEIFGLAPLSSYHCEIVAMANQEALCSASLITQQTPSTEQASSTTAQPQHQALRPSSPISTLKQSIQSAETKLGEARNKARKSKKDLRAVNTDIKKENSNSRSKLDSSGGQDERQERRKMQLQQHLHQAEEATADFKNEIEAFGAIPEHELAKADARRRSWQAAKGAMSGAKKDAEAAQGDENRELTALKNEITAIESKHEKLQTRRAQRSRDLEKLVTQQNADLTVRQQHDFERAQELQARAEHERQMQFHISQMESETAQLSFKASEALNQVQTAHGWASSQPPPYPGYSSPGTPENTFPAPNGTLSPQANGFPPFNAQSFNSPFHSQRPSLNQAPRGRSSSMLSSYSGFTEPDDEDASYEFEARQQQEWLLQANATAGAAQTDTYPRKESDGSGNCEHTHDGSAGSSSPRPDAKPFVPSAAAPVFAGPRIR